MGQAKIKSKRKRFIRLLLLISKQYDREQVSRFAEIRKLK